MSKLMTEHQLADIGKAHDFSWCALRYLMFAAPTPDCAPRLQKKRHHLG